MSKKVEFVVSDRKKIASRDKTLTRLIDILAKLTKDERYDSKELAKMYNVSVRTGVVT